MAAAAAFEQIVIPKDRTAKEAGRGHRFAAGRLLRQVMESLGLEPWEPEKDERGALVPRLGWYASKSHCHTMVAAACADQPIGIDVEPIRMSRVAQWDRVYNAEEEAVLGPLDALAFTRLWTAKEAILKADGIGLGGLSQCRVVAENGPDRLTLRHAGLEKEVQQKFPKSHVVSVYLEGSDTVSWAD